LSNSSQTPVIASVPSGEHQEHQDVIEKDDSPTIAETVQPSSFSVAPPPSEVHPETPFSATGMYMNPEFSPTKFEFSAKRKMFLPHYRFISCVISSSSTSDFPAISFPSV
jgi:hypothetical protein